MKDKEIHVVPWFGGQWRLVFPPSLVYFFWKMTWWIYYPLFKNRYEWREE